MYVLKRFGLKEMTDLNSTLRGLGEGTTCMEEVANRIVDLLYDGLLLEDGGDRVLGSSTQLIQLFQNLLGNSLKFRREGVKPVLEVKVRRNAENWLLTIQDNGIGFDASHADSVFTIFKRLHSRTAYPGTGIGLAVCKKIVENHGGQIWAESTPGLGSTFCFTIPIVPEPVPNASE